MFHLTFLQTTHGLSNYLCMYYLPLIYIYLYVYLLPTPTYLYYQSKTYLPTHLGVETATCLGGLHTYT
jgi:hypothetical protein